MAYISALTKSDFLFLTLLETHMQRRSLVAIATASLLATALIPSYAQTAASAWPTKPVRILVGFPGGSTPDIAARTLAEPLAKLLGQPVIIENKAGASGNIAAAQVASATDDHTLGVAINGNLTSARMLNPKLPYDPAKDFTYLSLLATAPLILVTPASLPQGREFFASAAKAGDKWSYGSVGVGSVGHLGTELLKTKVSGLSAMHVPFKGNPDIITSLIVGDIHLALMPPGVAMPHVKAGKLHAVGLAGGRSTLVPEVPPLSDAGVKDLRLEVWTAVIAPAKLSAEARKRLTSAIPAVLHSDEVRQKLFNQGWQSVGSSPEGLVSRVKEEATLMGRIISTQGIKIE